jgi:hypothetical protein
MKHLEGKRLFVPILESCRKLEVMQVVLLSLEVFGKT